MRSVFVNMVWNQERSVDAGLEPDGLCGDGWYSKQASKVSVLCPTLAILLQQ